MGLRFIPLSRNIENVIGDGVPDALAPCFFSRGVTGERERAMHIKLMGKEEN